MISSKPPASHKQTEDSRSEGRKPHSGEWRQRHQEVSYLSSRSFSVDSSSSLNSFSAPIIQGRVSPVICKGQCKLSIWTVSGKHRIFIKLANKQTNKKTKKVSSVFLGFPFVSPLPPAAPFRELPEIVKRSLLLFTSEMNTGSVSFAGDSGGGQTSASSSWMLNIVSKA